VWATCNSEYTACYNSPACRSQMKATPVPAPNATSAAESDSLYVALHACMAAGGCDMERAFCRNSPWSGTADELHSCVEGKSPVSVVVATHDHAQEISWRLSYGGGFVEVGESPHANAKTVNCSHCGTCVASRECCGDTFDFTYTARCDLPRHCHVMSWF